MSKSIGNVLSPDGIVGTYGLDQVRYFLMREMPHGQDGNFSHEQAVNRINSDLANSLGNLAQRTLSMIHKNCGEKIPKHGLFTDEDKKILDHAQEELLPLIRAEYDKFHIHRALEEIMRLSYDANAYIDHQAPWTLKKTDPARMETVLYVLAETVRCLALVMQPVTPASAEKMLDQLAVPGEERDFSFLSAAHALKSGTTIQKPEGVFPRLVDENKQAAAG
ncbi:MAG: class I tRNA ligase family protein, partial [Proteobacteria bacterium]|nr:class I tRNA ligase family protein [Pseudomonadota bacterium]